MAAGTGINSSIRVKKEATYATRPTGVSYIDVGFTSEGLQKNLKRGSSNNITANRARGGVFVSGQDVGGPLNGNITFENIDWLIWGILGTVASSGAGADKTNVYSPSAASAVPTFHLEVKRGDIPTGKIFRYSGVKVAGLTLTFDADSGQMSYAADLVAKDEPSANPGGDTAEATAATIASTTVLDTTMIAAAVTGSVLDIGTGATHTYCVKQATIKIVQPYTTTQCLGLTTGREPLASGFLDVTGEFVIEFEDRLSYNDFLNQTDMTAQLKFVGGVLGGSNYSFSAAINKFRYDSPSVGQVDGPGPILAHLNWTAFGTGGSAGSAQPIAFTTVNAINFQTAG